MKRLLKNVVFVFAFALAFVVGAVATVRAAELKNTNVSGAVASYEVAENKYYAVAGDHTEGTLTLKSKEKGAYNSNWYPGFYTYTARVSVVKCTEINGDNVCSNWAKYDYSKDKAKTNDDLAKGLKLGFADEKFAPLEGTTEVNGASLANLTSVYGVNKTYFVIVQYTWEKNCLFCKAETYSPEIFRVVFANEVEPLVITHTTNGTINVTVTSGTPISQIRYFYTMEELGSTIDFDTAYETNAANGVEVLAQVESDPIAENGIFTYTFTINPVSGAHYYVEAKDVGGHVVTYDVTQGSANQGETGNSNNDTEGNVGNTNVGKIILISLLVVLIVALVLVIVQKIVDYRKKLY